MPTKTVMKFASRISSMISGCWARFSVASQANCSGKPFFFCQATRCGSMSRVALRLPMKLSSTK